MGVHFVQQQRSAEKQTLKDVSTEKALAYIARKRGTHTPEQLAEMDARIHDDELPLLNGYHRDIRRRNQERFREIGRLMVGDKGDALRRKLTIEMERELRCWAQTNERIQLEYPEVLHAAHLLRPGLDPDFRAIQLGAHYLTLLRQPLRPLLEAELLRGDLRPTEKLLERHRDALDGGVLTPLLDASVEEPRPLLAPPVEPCWKRGAIQSAYLDYLEDALLLAATDEGLRVGDLRLLPLAEIIDRNAYAERAMDELGERLGRHLAAKGEGDPGEVPTGNRS